MISVRTTPSSGASVFVPLPEAVGVADAVIQAKYAMWRSSHGVGDGRGQPAKAPSLVFTCFPGQGEYTLLSVFWPPAGRGEPPRWADLGAWSGAPLYIKRYYKILIDNSQG